ncbi:Tol biopolymer transport system component [Bradyrhizobium sp. CIR48]|uniref:amidohydrolase family protein n=1 Tax=Bradyrhizobium sp. CIR48 TaxID=2663840 RepID=UPI0016056F02|nr:amidohydrolase family protein [Bradyrhizobium sp. CIR48]MBB4423799.1 Tol biopolymer transport system component [Bradyrhizobium sp. CIR48]
MMTTLRRRISRRKVLSLGGGAILAPYDLSLSAMSPSRDEHYAVVAEGTNISAAVSPTGQTVAFDLAGSLWLVDIRGGVARRITDELGDVAHPDWSPDGKEIVFQCYRDGKFHLWTICVDGTGLRQLTRGPNDDREPTYSPDGQRIAFSSDRGLGYGIYAFDRNTGAVKALVDTAAEETEPAWSRNGRMIAFVTNRSSLDVLDERGNRKEIASVQNPTNILNRQEIHAPSWSPDGDLTYMIVDNDTVQLHRPRGVVVQGEDVFPFRASWLPTGEFVYTSGGKIRRRRLETAESSVIEFSAQLAIVEPHYKKVRRDFDSVALRPVLGIGSPALSPNGRNIAFRALNDIWRMTIGERPCRICGDGFHKSDPAWSPDGRWLSYSSDRGGKLDIWLRDLNTGEDRQLTHVSYAAVSGSWSHDGKLIAFLDQTGTLYTIEVESGSIQKVYGPLWEPGRPSWGPDGRTIALAAFKPYSRSYREGLSEILTVDRMTGEVEYQSPLPHRSLGTRGDDGPVWSPDGTKVAFVLASLLYVASVDARCKLTSVPRAINAEVTDAPSWSGDSKMLLYLSNGCLRLIAADGGEPESVPLSIHWAMSKPAGRTVLRVGRLWDARIADLRENVDIVIDTNKIAAIVPQNGNTYGDAKIVDAPGSTAMPGLMDMHTHRQMQGYSYGDRQGRLWLSLGITTTRSVGSPAYHMLEDRESIESSTRVGPRHFGTGEAIDGSRIFYNFMRPLTEPGQLSRELQRAEALSYDLVKTYVRLAPEAQRDVIAWAHARGLHVTSHYQYPAAAFGADGMEHLGATSRLGYSRTMSRSGAAYQDVLKMFVQSGMTCTPTLFAANALLGEDSSWTDDIRIKTLYPTWEYARLKERIRLMSGPKRLVTLAELERNVIQVRELLRAGGRIITGTDAPIDFPAISLHLNLRAMVRFGVTPYQALLMASRYPGEFLGEPLGTIAEGALADIVLVDGNPLLRIEDAANVDYVIKNGDVFSVKDLLAPFVTTQVQHGRNKTLLPVRTSVNEARFWWHGKEFVENSRVCCCCTATPRLRCTG